MLCAEVGTRLVDDRHDLLRPLAQQHPLRSKRNAVAAADEQPLAKLVLEVLQLAGKRRLGDVQTVRGTRDAFLTRHRQKVFQHS